MGSRIIVALDFSSPDRAIEFVGRLDPAWCRLKVGFELFLAGGPSLVEQLRRRGFDVFLDLKFHDIPNTVASASRVAARLGVWMVNVHAAGGARMIEAAREALVRESHPPLLIAVTVLTSMAAIDLSEIGVTLDPADQVARLAELAARAGADGVVCSAREAARLRQQRGPSFCLVTPGIRPGSTADDQRRVMTPRAAIEAGSDYLVIGRPITQAADPVAALNEILVSLQT
ncbi:MAG: orotidine-5'-phosphate decarboxylase [Thiotrichales bacterium]